MQRVITISTILLLNLTVVGQKDSLQFEIGNYFDEAPAYMVTYKTVKNPKKTLTPEFYSQHFPGVYRFPDLMKPENSGQTLVYWARKDTPENYDENWKVAFVYNNEGRLIVNETSGCFICSFHAYRNEYFYDEKGRLTNWIRYSGFVDRDDDWTHKCSLVGSLPQNSMNARFEFYYDENDSVIQVLIYSYGLYNLDQSVTLLD